MDARFKQSERPLLERARKAGRPRERGKAAAPPRLPRSALPAPRRRPPCRAAMRPRRRPPRHRLRAERSAQPAPVRAAAPSPAVPGPRHPAARCAARGNGELAGIRGGGGEADERWYLLAAKGGGRWLQRAARSLTSVCFWDCRRE